MRNDQQAAVCGFSNSNSRGRRCCNHQYRGRLRRRLLICSLETPQRLIGQPDLPLPLLALVANALKASRGVSGPPWRQPDKQAQMIMKFEYHHTDEPDLNSTRVRQSSACLLWPNWLRLIAQGERAWLMFIWERPQSWRLNQMRNSLFSCLERACVWFLLVSLFVWLAQFQF